MRGRPNEKLEPTSQSKLKAIKKYQEKIKNDPEKYNDFKQKRKEYMKKYREKKTIEDNLDLEEIDLKIQILKLQRDKLKN